MLVLTLMLTSAWSWGPLGHRHIAEMAEVRLAPETRAFIDPLLQGASLADLSTRLDERRSDAGWDWVKPLHYVNVSPVGSTYDAARDCPDNRCVVEAIRWYAHRLHDPASSPAESLLALEMLTHLVGDLHQPLHVGLEADRGGNDVEVDWEGEPHTLHELWDSVLPAQPGALDRTEVGQASGTPTSWANESWSLTRTLAYPPANQPTPEWLAEVTPVISRRTSLAGVRLAWLLDRAVAGNLPFEAPAASYPTGRVRTTWEWVLFGGAGVLLALGAALLWRRRNPAAE